MPGLPRPASRQKLSVSPSGSTRASAGPRGTTVEGSASTTSGIHGFVRASITTGGAKARWFLTTRAAPWTSAAGSNRVKTRQRNARSSFAVAAASSARTTSGHAATAGSAASRVGERAVRRVRGPLHDEGAGREDGGGRRSGRERAAELARGGRGSRRRGRGGRPCCPRSPSGPCSRACPSRGFRRGRGPSRTGNARGRGRGAPRKSRRSRRASVTRRNFVSESWPSPRIRNAEAIASRP